MAARSCLYNNNLKRIVFDVGDFATCEDWEGKFLAEGKFEA